MWHPNPPMLHLIFPQNPANSLLLTAMMALLFSILVLMYSDDLRAIPVPLTLAEELIAFEMTLQYLICFDEAISISTMFK